MVRFICCFQCIKLLLIFLINNFFLGNGGVSTRDTLINTYTTVTELLTNDCMFLLIHTICFIYILYVIFFIGNDQVKKVNSQEINKENSQDLGDFDSAVTVLVLQQPGL